MWQNDNRCLHWSVLSNLSFHLVWFSLKFVTSSRDLFLHCFLPIIESCETTNQSILYFVSTDVLQKVGKEDSLFQARNQRGAIGQLLSPKFAQMHVFVWYSNKIHHFGSSENISWLRSRSVLLIIWCSLQLFMFFVSGVAAVCSA